MPLVVWSLPAPVRRSTPQGGAGSLLRDRLHAARIAMEMGADVVKLSTRKIDGKDRTRSLRTTDGRDRRRGDAPNASSRPAVHRWSASPADPKTDDETMLGHLKSVMNASGFRRDLPAKRLAARMGEDHGDHRQIKGDAAF